MMIWLICVYLKFDEEVYNSPVKFLLDLNGIRKKPMIYRYIGIVNLENEPVFDENNILLNDIKEIKEEILNDKHLILKRMIESGFTEESKLNTTPWIQINEENLLDIN